MSLIFQHLRDKERLTASLCSAGESVVSGQAPHMSGVERTFPSGLHKTGSIDRRNIPGNTSSFWSF